MIKIVKDNKLYIKIDLKILYIKNIHLQFKMRHLKG